ncbi:MAG: rod-binding protein [Myxococcales bacterium]|nr:rod-binding protein [Myxococcales bacterium]
MTVDGDLLAAHVPALELSPRELSVPEDGQDREALAEAARQFEGLLINELMKVMRKTAPMLSSGQGKMYLQMFDAEIAQQMASSGGIGLSSVVAQALGGEQGAGQEMAAAVAGRDGAVRYAGQSAASVGLARAGVPVSLMGEPGAGHTARLQRVAADMVLHGASRWSRVGALSSAELASDFSSGEAHFNVRDAMGYQGHPKCNLFAFEVARRAGFQVPLVPRAAGWGFPSAEAVTEDAASGRLPRSWGKVVTGMQAADADAAAQAGSRAFMLVGSGDGERPGHMAVVERVHRIDYDKRGRVERVVFDGWEARTRGAQHLTHRTWNRYGNPGGTLARSGFGRIEIIELKAAEAGARPELPTAISAPGSIRDKLPSSPPAQGPIPR